jgi:hypothetical protein
VFTRRNHVAIGLQTILNGELGNNSIPVMPRLEEKFSRNSLRRRDWRPGVELREQRGRICVGVVRHQRGTRSMAAKDTPCH